MNDSRAHRFLDIPFEDDLQERMDPSLVSELLAEAVPAVRACGFRVTAVDDGACRSLLPLQRSNTNQHGTHQALLMGVAGDYTGGTALSSLLRGLPVVGIHPVFSDDAVLLWLVSASIKYREPSCSDLTVRSTVPPERHDGIRERFLAGRTQLVPLEVSFRGEDGTLVATATMTYYLKHAAHLRPDRPGKSGGTMYRHLLKTSARLIANVRGRAAEAHEPLFEDPWSLRAAGRHGALLGERFLEVLPELLPMVASRTRHADDALRAALAGGVRQVVLMGAGLDVRPFRVGRAHPAVRWFELDLPEMLEERDAVLGELELPSVDHHRVPANLDFDDPDETLRNLPAFEPDAPVFVLYEGMSMYFDDARTAWILERLGRLAGAHPDSRLWMDLVATEVIEGSRHPEVRRFTDNMARMGESFVFGIDDPAALLAPHGLALESVDDSDVYAPSDNPLFRLYRYAVFAPRPSGR